MLMLLALMPLRVDGGAGDHAGLPGAPRTTSATAHLPAASPFEPTVTRAEAQLLRRAAELLETDPKAAIALLEDAQSPDSSAALDFALGNFHYQAEELEQAAVAYRAAIGKMPLFRQALNNLGRVSGPFKPSCVMVRAMPRY
jgi:hypothetical protein